MQKLTGERLNERQALAVKTTNFQQQLLAPLGEQAEEIIKDPYVFDFLPNVKKMKEVELENALVQQVTNLLLKNGLICNFAPDRCKI